MIEDIEDKPLNIEYEDIFEIMTIIPHVEIVNTIVIKPVKIIIMVITHITNTFFILLIFNFIFLHRKLF